MNQSLTLRRLTAVVTFALAAIVSACGGDKADLVIRNGKVVTVDNNLPEAQAVAIKGDRILAVGSNDEIAGYIGSATEVIDLNGQLVIPGFQEGHGHFMRVGQAKMQLDLVTPRNWDEIVDLVANAAREAKPGEWISGRGWHQEKWDRLPADAVEGLPVHAELSRVSPNNPVVLTHASGHAAFANAKAMELAGITAATPNPPGGEIVKDRAGNPTGALRETAQRLVTAVRARDDSARSPEERLANDVRAVELASQEALSKGVTSFHDAGSSFETIDLLKRLAEEGKLPIRLYVMIRYASNDELASKLPQYRIIRAGNNHLTVRSIKRQIDGALGSHGAWLLQPYEDMRTSTGLVLETVEEVTRTAELALEHGFQLNTHAIGDRANREVLDIYEKLFAANPDKRDLRWRIEHAQHLHPNDIPRFANLGVIASMQGVHATSDAPWVYRRLGAERARTGAYMWHSLMKTGAVVTNGTDAPVENLSAIASFHSSVSRMTADGSVFFPEERMTREEALRTYTYNVAYSAFEEDILGSITPGKLADIAILSDDILTIPENQIPAARVLYTVVGGKVLYRGDGAR